MVEIEHIKNDKEESWYIKGTRTHHREDGPAWIGHYTGATSYIWARNGDMHRLDGPAFYRIRKSDGLVYSEEYWINGKQYTKEEFDEYVKGLHSKEDKELLGDLGQTFE